MTNTHITLESVSFALPNGRALFTNLNEQFDLRHTGLVGRNGVGKTILAHILAGQLQPSAGRCVRSGNVHYLSQQIALPKGLSIAALAGTQDTLDALHRIEAGSTNPQDFDAVGNQWDAAQRLRQALADNGLSHLNITAAASALSGGEAMRVALIGAWLSDADYLILDEPTNHLDRINRQALIAALKHWRKGLLVISHDRELLDNMTRIVELSQFGLNSYGGNYAFYAQCKAHEHNNAVKHLEQTKQHRKREALALRKQTEQQERRQARGSRQAQDSNQAKILLGRQKQRSENTAGKLTQQHAAVRANLNQQVQEAARLVANDQVISLHALPITTAAQRRVAEVNEMTLPFVASAAQRISLTVFGGQRIGVIGANGSGKSTLLKVLAGQLEPLAGRCAVTTQCAYLDQRLSNLASDQTVLAQIIAANPRAGENVLRMQLAHLGLDADKIVLPSGELSGGERLKAALACVLYAENPAELLLLDEPSNHLDLPSLQALEAMLQGYRGALMVVSHDAALLNNLRLTDRLEVTAEGWRMTAW